MKSSPCTATLWFWKQFCRVSSAAKTYFLKNLRI
jgi:hypothetical protein